MFRHFFLVAEEVAVWDVVVIGYVCHNHGVPQDISSSLLVMVLPSNVSGIQDFFVWLHWQFSVS